MNLGMARYMGGHPDQALPVLRKAVRLNESLAPASLFLGASLLDLGQFAEAATPLQRAVTLMPNNPDAREMLARSYLGVVAAIEGRAAVSNVDDPSAVEPEGLVRPRAKLRRHRRGRRSSRFRRSLPTRRSWN